jgi:hypothetical protein
MGSSSVLHTVVPSTVDRTVHSHFKGATSIKYNIDVNILILIILISINTMQHDD